MSDLFLILGSIFVFIAAIVHLRFFFLKSVLWSKPSTWRAFGVASQQDADVLRFMAYNQGFYNIFLAFGAGAGLVLIGSGASLEGGIGIAAFALLSMLLASIVLVTANRKMWRGALLQGLPPLLGLVSLALRLLTA